jgi:hypothetical protein
MRSLLLFVALLLAFFAAAQWSDVFVSHWLNMTPAKLCAVDKPTVCVYVPKLTTLTNIDTSKTLLMAVYWSGTATRYSTTLLSDYAMLQAVAYSRGVTVVVNVTKPGLLYSPYSFNIYSFSSGVSGSTTSYRACGGYYSNAYSVDPGLYQVSNLWPPLYFLDVNTCTSYRLVDLVSNVDNVTVPWFSLYMASMLPNTTKIYYDSNWWSWNLNGTKHLYRTHFYSRTAPLGFGIYITDNVVRDTLVMPYDGRVGPQGYDTLQNATINYPPYGAGILYNIGQYPGDGAVFANIPTVPYGPSVKVTHIADGTAGYAVINVTSYFAGSGYFTYAAFFKRYAVVEVAAQDMVYTYATRGIACPYVAPGGGQTVYVLNRLDRVQEVEICNNATSPLIVALYYKSYYSTNIYFFADRIDPGACRRLRWDSYITSKPEIDIFTSERNFCNYRYAAYTMLYNPGWRHYLFANYTLKAAVPISPDAAYAAMWQQVMQTMAQMYNATNNAIQQWLKQQAATAQSLQSLAAATPQFQGTIKMDSSTSTWLQTTLNQLQKYQVVGPSVGGTISVSLQAPSAFTAAASAAAVATAWAASRKTLATAAFLAGFAVLATSLFVYYLYGAMVTTGLILAAVALMSIGAAAAWFRKSED